MIRDPTQSVCLSGACGRPEDVPKSPIFQNEGSVGSSYGTMMNYVCFKNGSKMHWVLNLHIGSGSM